MPFDPRLNHSAAHLLAMAVKQLFPDVRLGIGPATDEGFYYDFLLESEAISEKDLPKIEKAMQKLVSGAHDFFQSTISLAEGRSLFSEEPLKLELLEELAGDISIYRSSPDFIDLCAGPHVDNTKRIKHFKLLSVAGAYWRGDAKKPRLVRIYGTAWATKEELDEFLVVLEERRQRDHRRIGKDMEIFMFDQLAGQGLPMWLPNGMIIKNVLQRYLQDKVTAHGFSIVGTPVLGSAELYKTSGHWEHYRENMFAPIQVDNETLVLRPMTCPHHCLLFKGKQHSYRELPVKLFEDSILHRYEYSGALSGLERVRAMHLPDAHVFCREDQIETVVLECYRLISEAATDLQLKSHHIALSLHDPSDKEKFFDDKQLWHKAESGLRRMLDKNHIAYTEEIGEAAFYGPKIDFQFKTAMGKMVTISTIQLDFLLPSRFGLEYKDSTGTMVPPILVHLSIMSTFERLMATILEQTKGQLPLWLAPLQAVIIPVNENTHADFAFKIKAKLQKAGIRTEVDVREERLAKKIRDAQLAKTPYQLVIGDEEMKHENNLTYRAYGSTETTLVAITDFVDMV